MIFFIIRSRHQSIFGVGGDWTPDFELIRTHSFQFQLQRQRKIHFGKQAVEQE